MPTDTSPKKFASKAQFRMFWLLKKQGKTTKAKIKKRLTNSGGYSELPNRKATK